MPKKRMADVIVLLPGVTGSVLQKDGAPVWAVSGTMLWEALWQPGHVAEALTVKGDDPLAEDLGDGVRATGLIRGLSLIPGLITIVDGYGAIADSIQQYFEVVPGTPESAGPANFLEFPYDWRRDNRFTARRLQRVLEEVVPRWRRYTGNPDAKAVVVAHSMGGLIARYCLEVLEAWPLCRALVTFGTPFRGSVQALDYLSNGYKKLTLDLTEALRSCTSVYQLLPMYEAIRVGSDWVRAGETAGIPFLDGARAEAALAFYREIEAAEKRPKGGGGYLTLPLVGTDQPTLQSACLESGVLRCSREAPEWIDPLLAGGDGTVPYCSAIPLSMSHSAGWPQVAERHGALQSHKGLLMHLRNTLTQTQIRGFDAIHDLPGPPTPERSRPAISVDAEDVYRAAEPVVLRAALRRVAGTGGLTVRVEAVGEAPVDVGFVPDGDGLKADLGVLGPALYRATVSSTGAEPAGPDPVHVAFAVI
jgi:pimeloyl-ACP methyl ester carboxylesterase